MTSQVTLASVTLADPMDQNALGFAFENEGALHYESLSHSEMIETEGNVLPYFVGGAGVGSATYLGSTAYRSLDMSSNYGFNLNSWDNFTNNFSGTDLLWAAGAGAVGGGYSQALFKNVGYTGFVAQSTAPALVQIPIRSGGAGAGFATFGVHGYPTTNFNNNFPGSNSSFSNSNSFSGFNCGSCYRGRN